ncbi:MAG: phosphoglycerate dehydrogenase [Acutalibacteraceae bacterium]|jgi:D-3-phosphoglycerate dehydrogenase|nr:phosphoglycerate dehydrogenase [Clostridiales bacterium]
MFKVLTLNKISPSGLEHFNRKTYTYGSELENPDAIMVRSASMHDMDFADNTLAIARAGAGVNNIPIDKCSEKGIVVFNTPGANANAVKELVMCALFLTSRKIIPAIDFCKTLKGEGEEVGKLVEKGKSAFAGPEIHGKKLGVIGLGAIGILVANCAKSLGMEVYGYDPFLSVDAAWNLSRSIKHASSLQDIFSNCDYISVHVPLNSETKDLINAASIASMKDGIRILNFSRGELVNSEDVLEALSTGKVAAYATDFPTDDLIGASGVIAIPHLGASTPESEDNCARMAVFELIDYLENGSIRNSVNLPDVELLRTTACRVCVIHKNIPNTLNQITSPFTNANINIDNMVNRSKKDYAYTILDTEGDIDNSIIETIRGINGVLRVRVIK